MVMVSIEVCSCSEGVMCYSRVGCNGCTHVSHVPSMSNSDSGWADIPSADGLIELSAAQCMTVRSMVDLPRRGRV